MAYTQHSKCCGGNPMSVRVRPAAFNMPKTKLPDKIFTWTPELAYTIGLLATDGNLSSDGRHIVMRSADYDLLETFRVCLHLKNKIGVTDIGRRDHMYRIQFSNVQFYNWLITIGITPAKTYTIGAIKIPNEFFRDFLRGHLDGDGSITTYEDRYNTFKNPSYIYQRFIVRFISASEQHIRWLDQKIRTILEAQGRIHRTKPTDPTRQVDMWILKFGKKESINLLSKLYYHENLPSLSRKREIAFKMFNTVKKSQNPVGVTL